MGSADFTTKPRMQLRATDHLEYHHEGRSRDEMYPGFTSLSELSAYLELSYSDIQKTAKAGSLPNTQTSTKAPLLIVPWLSKIPEQKPIVFRYCSNRIPLLVCIGV